MYITYYSLHQLPGLPFAKPHCRGTDLITEQQNGNIVIPGTESSGNLAAKETSSQLSKTLIFLSGSGDAGLRPKRGGSVPALACELKGKP